MCPKEYPTAPGHLPLIYFIFGSLHASPKSTETKIRLRLGAKNQRCCKNKKRNYLNLSWSSFLWQEQLLGLLQNYPAVSAKNNPTLTCKVAHPTALRKAHRSPFKNRMRKCFLTYISCVVHKNAAFATFGGGILSLHSGMRGESDLGSDQGKSGWHQGSHCTAGPSPLLSSCTGYGGGGPQGCCSCVLGPTAEVTVR